MGAALCGQSIPDVAGNGHVEPFDVTGVPGLFVRFRTLIA
jgi:hypothetical protein